MIENEILRRLGLFRLTGNRAQHLQKEIKNGQTDFGQNFRSTYFITVAVIDVVSSIQCVQVTQKIKAYNRHTACMNLKQTDIA